MRELSGAVEEAASPGECRRDRVLARLAEKGTGSA